MKGINKLVKVVGENLLASRRITYFFIPPQKWANRGILPGREYVISGK
jgi:hypothetical protein